LFSNIIPMKEADMAMIPTPSLARWSLTAAMTSSRTVAIAGAGITALELVSGVCAIVAVGAIVLKALAPRQPAGPEVPSYLR
jgi:hypothetical protein